MRNLSLEELNQELQEEKYFVVDQHIFDLYRGKLNFLQGKHTFLVEAPESQKSFDGLSAVTDFLLENGITRKDTVVAVGGGALSDLTGFAASIVLRGVSWICVPTTLLSCADAAIGGKTAINTAHGKNMVGAFHGPEKILFCADFLKTLPEEELTSGKGEVLKSAFLDKRVYDSINAGDSWEKIVILCAQMKSEVVEKDFKETGERAKLNLGHTFGHAIETLSSLPHGQCVAMGLEIAIDLFCPSLQEELHSLSQTLGMKWNFPKGLNADRFWNILAKDKKSDGDAISFLVPHSIGDVRIEKKTITELKSAFEKHDKYLSFFK